MITGFGVDSKKIEEGNMDFLSDQISSPSDETKLLEEHYKNARDNQSDINEHIETFYKYGKECTSVIECGVRSCVSTWGFMKGLKENKQEMKHLVGLDLNNHPNIDFARHVSTKNGIKHDFFAGDDLLFPLKEGDDGYLVDETDIVEDGKRKKMFDCLFIDSLHVYQQCALELSKFSDHIRKYIILHDTQIDHFTGEFLRWGGEQSVMSLAQNRGWDPALIRLGLWPAVCEFVTRSKGEWVLEHEFTHNNGLTILRRKDVLPLS